MEVDGRATHGAVAEGEGTLVPTVPVETIKTTLIISANKSKLIG